MTPILSFFVAGEPAPQGSKKIQGQVGQRGRLVESSKKVAPWRQDVVAATVLALEANPAWRPAIEGDGPIKASMIFLLRKPAGLSKRKTASGPMRKPDLSKLVRSTEDALTTAGAWADDARVTMYVMVHKMFAPEGKPTGCYITLGVDDPGAV